MVHQAVCSAPVAKQKPYHQVKPVLWLLRHKCSPQLGKTVSTSKWLARSQITQHCGMQIVVHKGKTLVPGQQVAKRPLGGFSKAAALYVGLDKLPVASNINEQLERQLHTLQEQLEKHRNQVAKACAKAEHFRRLYEHVMSKARS